MREINFGTTAGRIVRDALLGFLAFVVVAFLTLPNTASTSFGSFTDVLNFDQSASVLQLPDTSLKSFQKKLPGFDLQAVSTNNTDTQQSISLGSATSEAFGRTSKGTATLILALLFTSVVVFNLAFLRHLKHVHVRSKRCQRQW